MRTVHSMKSGEVGYVRCTDIWVSSLDSIYVNFGAKVHGEEFAKGKIEMIKIFNNAGKLELDLANYKHDYKWRRQVITANVHSVPTSMMIVTPDRMPAKFLEPDLLFSLAHFADTSDEESDKSDDSPLLQTKRSHPSRVALG